MTNRTGTWSAAAVISTIAIAVMSLPLINAATDIVTINCTEASIFSPPTDILPGQHRLQTFRIDAATVRPNRTCSFTLDAHGPYALDATSMTIGDSATTVTFLGSDQYTPRLTLNSSTTPPSATGFISTRVLTSVLRGASVQNDNQFNVTFTVDWYRFTGNYYGSVTLTATSPWLVIDASKPGITRLYATDEVALRLYVVDFGNGTAEQLAANQGVLVYTTLVYTIDAITNTPERVGRKATNNSYYQSSEGLRLLISDSYSVYVDERYSTNRLMLVFMLDTPASHTVPTLYPITPNNVTKVGSFKNSPATPVMILSHPSLAAVRLDDLQSTEDISVVVGSPKIVDIGPVIFNSSISQLPEWSGVLVRSQLFTILGTLLNVTLTGVTTLNVTNARVRQRGVFMSKKYGALTFDYNSSDSRGYYINDVQTVSLGNGVSARTFSYQIDRPLLFSGWMSLSAPDGSRTTNYTTQNYLAAIGAQGSVKSSGLELQSLSKSSMDDYLVRWMVDSAVDSAADSAVVPSPLFPAIVALSMLTSLLFH